MNLKRILSVLLALLMLLLAPAAWAKTITVDAANHDIEKDGWYITANVFFDDEEVLMISVLSMDKK